MNQDNFRFDNYKYNFAEWQRSASRVSSSKENGLDLIFCELLFKPIGITDSYSDLWIYGRFGYL